MLLTSTAKIILMRVKLIPLLIAAAAMLYSCGSLNKMDKYMKESRENSLGTFVAYKNGDTLRGNKIRVQVNGKDYQDDIYLDGKLMDRSEVLSYQSSRALNESGFTRILKGKKSLYSRTDRVAIPSYKNEPGRTSVTPYTTTSTLHLRHEDGRLEIATYKSLSLAFRDCPSALKRLKKDPDFRFERENPNSYIPGSLGGTVAKLLETDNAGCV